MITSVPPNNNSAIFFSDVYNDAEGAGGWNCDDDDSRRCESMSGSDSAYLCVYREAKQAFRLGEKLLTVKTNKFFALHKTENCLFILLRLFLCDFECVCFRFISIEESHDEIKSKCL